MRTILGKTAREYRSFAEDILMAKDGKKPRRPRKPRLLIVEVGVEGRKQSVTLPILSTPEGTVLYEALEAVDQGEPGAKARVQERLDEIVQDAAPEILQLLEQQGDLPEDEPTSPEPPTSRYQESSCVRVAPGQDASYRKGYDSIFGAKYDPWQEARYKTGASKKKN